MDNSQKTDSLQEKSLQTIEPLQQRQLNLAENFFIENNENLMVEPTKKLQTCHNYATTISCYQNQRVSSPIKPAKRLKKEEFNDENEELNEEEFEQDDYLSGDEVQDEFNTFSSSEGTSGRMGEETQISGGYNKPSYSYSCLIGLSLKNSISGELTVSEIYSFLW